MLLLTLGFKSLAVGTSALTFENVTLGDVNGVEREHSTTNGSITVLFAQLPEPGTLALLGGAGLIVLPLRWARAARDGSPTHRERPRHWDTAMTRQRLERRGAQASRWR